MTNAFDYQRDREREEDALDGADMAPDSGIHAREDGGVFDVGTFDALRETLERRVVEKADAGKMTADFPASGNSDSFIAGLLRKIGITSVPPEPKVKERIPMDEQELIDMIKSEEERLIFFGTIVENRERLYLHTLSVGMTDRDIKNSADYRLDQAATGQWKQRVIEKKREIVELRMKLETKKLQRLSGNSFRPPQP